MYAFKPQPDRYLCFFKKGKKIIVTNGFCKRTNKLPLAEKAIALENKQMYEHLYEE
nr:type II toxin-antitoxin system RelE/ParE family toxin [Treponema pedis]